ncbi:mitochondrial basic amino acids transporter [Leptopilina heterotoma]|uniref:mitochondrial basic amino acids transporter n=1 Tax=Leptopilina heterotoma TaxID=63436 RepID=UPI001CA9A002|nr:mitochondrial basic amino acids transporter [Leptopilina heterotoma]
MALDFLAGCLGGCAGILVGYPLDTVKVHIQTQDHNNPKYKGTWHCFRSLMAKDSIHGLYRGMSSPMAGVAAVNAIVFGVYGTTHRTFAESEHLGIYFLAGASAGMAQTPVCSPIELAKTRLQLQNSDNRSGPLKCLKDIYKREGSRGLFNGLGITLVREIPSYGIYFLTYEALTRSSSPNGISTWYMLLAGGLAGTASWVFTYPVDVVKSRIQADTVGKYNGALDCLEKSIKSEGVTSLFRGLNSTIIRAFPTNAVTFTIVTWTLKLFSKEPKVDEITNKNCVVSSSTPVKETFIKEWNSILNNIAMHQLDISRSYYTSMSSSSSIYFRTIGKEFVNQDCQEE